MTLVMKVILFSLLFIQFFLAFGEETNHFFTQDDCQFWKLKDTETNIIEKVWYFKNDTGVVIKQGYQKDSENSFYHTWNLVDLTISQVNKHPYDIDLCKTEPMTQEEKDSIIVVRNQWEEMINKQEYLGSSNDGTKQKWRLKGLQILGSGYSDVIYVEKDQFPFKLKFMDDNGETAKILKVKKFKTDCKKITDEWEKEKKRCEESSAQGNSFPETGRRRTTFRQRLGTISKKSYYGSLSLRNITHNNKKQGCSIGVAHQALSRASTTSSMEYGNWCGVGGEKGVCCQTVCPDGGYDVLCRKHDSSTYWEKMLGATVSPCMVDVEFLQESKDFNGCVGDENAPWRVDPDPTGAVSCEETRKAAVNTFSCMPCINYECKDDVWDWSVWDYVRECDWTSYWTGYPNEMACNGPCWDESMEPFGYEYYYNTPCK